MNAILTGFKAALLAVVTRVLTIALTSASGWLAAKGWLPMTESQPLLNVFYVVAIGLIGVGLDWVLTRPAVAWIAATAQKGQGGE